jgi:hypothetical protein
LPHACTGVRTFALRSLSRWWGRLVKGQGGALLQDLRYANDRQKSASFAPDRAVSRSRCPVSAKSGVACGSGARASPSGSPARRPRLGPGKNTDVFFEGTASKRMMCMKRRGGAADRYFPPRTAKVGCEWEESGRSRGEEREERSEGARRPIAHAPSRRANHYTPNTSGHTYAHAGRAVSRQAHRQP